MGRSLKSFTLVSLLLCSQITVAFPEGDPLEALGVVPSKGAAAGYIPDKVCATCHPQLYESYQAVGMARSFARPERAKLIEEFGKEYYHEPSQRYYRIDRVGKTLVFHRYQRDKDGKSINEFEREIDWVMGSGNRARSYIYQNPWGELYELPLGWYSEGKRWGMSPGFEEKKHLGVLRQVKRECMFCHNAFPDVPAGSDAHWQPDLFPKELPEGTGCQRCHGPGAEHVRAAFRGKSLETVHDKIINPRKLPPRQRDSVCFQCHMLPSVTMVGARQVERPIYSFRPGQDLSEYQVHVEITNSRVKPEDHFEINHHGYRFWQSACFQKSEGTLACISCHDPHVKPTSASFRSKVAKICTDCHETEVQNHQPKLLTNADCAGCHMPTRRTQDVILATMTDHRIARGPFDHKALLEPRTIETPVLTGIALLPWGKPPKGLADLYRVLPVVRNFSYDAPVKALDRMVKRVPMASPVPALNLAEAQIKLDQFPAAEATLNSLIKDHPNLTRAHDLLGTALLLQGKNQKAVAAFEKALGQQNPSVQNNLAVAAFSKREYAKALRYLDDAIALRPTSYGSWRTKGRVFAQAGQLQKARESFERALEIEPGDSRTYTYLIRLLRRMDETAEADRYLELGLRVTWNPKILEPFKQKSTPIKP